MTFEGIGHRMLVFLEKVEIGGKGKIPLADREMLVFFPVVVVEMEERRFFS